MTDGTQELDVILTGFAYGEYSPHWTDERRTYTKLEAKQAILDWHNKQIEEVLDRIEARKEQTIYADFESGSVSWWAAVLVSSIEAERNKLKEK